MAASVELLADSVRPVRPQVFFPLPTGDTSFGFQPSRDGQRFLVFEPEDSAQQQRSMVVVQNCAARLQEGK